MKCMRAGCDDGMNMISHGQAASNGYSKNFKKGIKILKSYIGAYHQIRHMDLTLSA